MLFPVEFLKIEKWRAFKGSFPPGSGTPHRIVIIYKHGNDLKYFYITSYDSEERIRKIKLNNRNDPRSVAEITTEYWNELTNDSCVQCNKAHMHCENIDTLKEQYALGTFTPLGEVPDKIKREIIQAVCASESFTEKEKLDYTI